MSTLLISLLALLLVACSQDNPATPAARTLPYGNLEMTMTWAFLCHTGIVAKPYSNPALTMLTIRTARGNLVILSAPTWQVDLAEKECAAHAARSTRTIGE